MKQLIVNADDIGADEARNAGIFDAIEAGIVTSGSLLPNGPALEDAVRRIRALHLKSVSYGVHLNLSEGKPISPGLRRLAGSDGSFLGKAAARRLLMHRGDAELQKEILEEIAAQIKLIQDTGIPIDHMDGHQHVHVFPAVVTLAAEAAQTCAIPWIRIPEESPDDSPTGSLSSAVREEGEFFSEHAQAARPLFSAMGICATAHFRGLYMKGHLPSSQWMEFLEAIPQGLTELMVHPGRAAAPRDSGPFIGFSTIEREKELEALMDRRFRAALLKTGVGLTPFPGR